jgi:hypothetical protein
MMVKQEDIYLELVAALTKSGLYSPAENGGGNVWRISSEPYCLSAQDVRFFSDLGQHLLKFYSALNQLYLDSVKGKIPSWFAEYLDLGKPSDLIDYGRMNKFRQVLPGIIRPDVLVTAEGFAVSELDSVPGGFGLLSCLSSLYERKDRPLVGDAGGIPSLFYNMIENLADSPTLAIVVSDEARDYLPEMEYLKDILRLKGLPVYVAHPKDLLFREEGIFLPVGEKEVQVDVIYRFFELFDLKNIPKSELLMYSNKKGKVKITPPFKPFLEEKLGFALFHHPSLTTLWKNMLGAETFATLSHLIPKTWILDNRQLPPYGVIPGLIVKDNCVREWKELNTLTQKERELVVKVSGFSAQAWGSRGVTMGHDVSTEEWQKVLEQSLDQFSRQPSILQVFHKGKQVKVSYMHPQTKESVEMQSRARLTPYYFVVNGTAKLGGIMATLCPHDKKKIHGMTDAVIVPCALQIN